MTGDAAPVDTVIVAPSSLSSIGGVRMRSSEMPTIISVGMRIFDGLSGRSTTKLVADDDEETLRATRGRRGEESEKDSSVDPEPHSNEDGLKAPQESRNRLLSSSSVVDSSMSTINEALKIEGSFWRRAESTLVFCVVLGPVHRKRTIFARLAVSFAITL